MQILLYSFLFVNLFLSALTYSIPDPKVEILSPKGVRISIPRVRDNFYGITAKQNGAPLNLDLDLTQCITPGLCTMLTLFPTPITVITNQFDENGIALVAFHVNINKALAMNQPGDYTADITQPVNGKWVFDNTQTYVDPGDKVNYWLHVQYGNYAYRKLGSIVATGDSISVSSDSPLLDEDSQSSSKSPDIESDCIPSKTTVDRKPVCKGQLIFEDNFNSLNWTKWRREVRLPMGVDDAEFVSFQDREDNCYVNNGQLHIVPSLLSEVPGFNESTIRTGKLDLGSRCTAIIDITQECVRQAQFSQVLPPIVSARIRTKDSFSFRFGKIEVRAKLPKGDWLFPLILLEPLENYYGFTGYASGQVRVAFVRGNEHLDDSDGNEISGHRVAGGVVLSVKESLRDVWLKGSLRRSHLGDDFHIYTLTWTDDFIAVEIDGNEYAIIRGGFARFYRTHNIQHAKLWDNGDYMAPFDREFFLTLGVSAGGHSDFPDESHNGVKRLQKPWKNSDPKAELQFWNDRANWLKTWNGVNAGLHVDYVRVYAL